MPTEIWSCGTRASADKIYAYPNLILSHKGGFWWTLCPPQLVLATCDWIRFATTRRIERYFFGMTIEICVPKMNLVAQGQILIHQNPSKFVPVTQDHILVQIFLRVNFIWMKYACPKWTLSHKDKSWYSNSPSKLDPVIQDKILVRIF